MFENRCYTYFCIQGDFDPDEVTKILGLEPNKKWKIGDTRRNGTKYDFATWQFGKNDKYDVITESQMHETIEPLLSKIDLLNQIRENNDVMFSLVIVPSLYAGNISPCLAPSLKVIDFCHATRTEMDIDLYLMDKNEEETFEVDFDGTFEENFDEESESN